MSEQSKFQAAQRSYDARMPDDNETPELPACPKCGCDSEQERQFPKSIYFTGKLVCTNKEKCGHVFTTE